MTATTRAVPTGCLCCAGTPAQPVAPRMLSSGASWARSFAVASIRGCAILFNRNTFECNVESRHEYVTADTGCADCTLDAVVASYEAAPLSQTDRLAECLSRMPTAWTWPNATRRADDARRAGMTENGTTPYTQSVGSRQSGRSHDQGPSCSNSEAL